MTDAAALSEVTAAGTEGAPMPDVDTEKQADGIPLNDLTKEAERGGNRKFHVRTRMHWYQFWLYKDDPPPPPESLDDSKELPIAKLNLFSDWTYHWIMPLLKLGYRRPLEATDLWKMDDPRTAKHISNLLIERWTERVAKADAHNERLERGEINPSVKLMKKWRKEAEKESATNLGGEASVEERVKAKEACWRSPVLKYVKAEFRTPELRRQHDIAGKVKTASKRANLFFALFDIFWPNVTVAYISKLLGDTAYLGSTLLMEKIIDAVSKEDTGLACGYVVVMFAIMIISNLLTNRFYYQSMYIGVFTRAALVSGIYKRALNMQGRDRSTGKLVNHISTDVSRIDFGAQWWLVTFTAPVELIVCIIILLSRFGVSCLSGFALVVVVLPIQASCMKFLFDLRNKSLEWTDRRARRTQEVLSGMRIVKLFSYESNFLQWISKLRRNELKYIFRLTVRLAALLATAIGLPVLAGVLAVITFYFKEGHLDASKVFPAVTLFQLIRLPLMFLPFGLSVIADGYASILRLSEVFYAQQHDVSVKSDALSPYGLQFTDAQFEWDDVSEDPTLKPTTTEEKKEKRKQKQKQKRLWAFLRKNRKNVPASEKKRLGLFRRKAKKEDLALIGGKPKPKPVEDSPSDFIMAPLNLAIKLGLDSERNNGDLTEIGERGVTLSAVDAHVGKALFNNAILPLRSRGKTILLVTHAIQYLEGCDRIVSMDDGRIEEVGTFAELMAARGHFYQTMQNYSTLRQTGVEEDANDLAAEVEAGKSKPKLDTGKLSKPGGNTMELEERNTGAVDMFVWKAYLRAGEHSVMQFIFNFIADILLGLMTYFASRKLHDNAMKRVMYSPMAWFDTTPIGRIINRFGKDIDVLDNQVSGLLRQSVATFMTMLGAGAMIIALTYYFAIVIVGVLLISWFISTYYRASSREFKRVDALLRSTLYSHFAESLTGLTTIRAYNESKRFLYENYKAMDLQNRAYFLTIVNRRWLGLRLDLLGSLCVLVVGILAAVRVHGMGAGQSGVVLSMMITIAQSLSMLTSELTELENEMNSAERLVYYAETLDQEAPQQIPDTKPPASWPDHGAIDLDNLWLKYRPNLPNVLKGVTLHVNGGEKVGIVGRTGAGKSSILTVLLRLSEATQGTISIDGINVSMIGLEDLRLAIAILPQEPLLFSGTLRSNLDPFGLYDDARLWDAMQRAYLTGPTSATTTEDVIHDPSVPMTERTKMQGDAQAKEPGTESKALTRLSLDSIIDEEGANLSVGQRSLVSLARALVRNSKIILLDEATASVDLETDAKIQKTIRTEFADRTLLCIAHRLSTIIGYDRIVVMEDGKVVEFDTPLTLFDRSDGIFRGMCSRSSISRDDILQARP
ncbi:uncharacterized protein MJAP1_003409 [Malassezia japonica]|uniref:Uncharacterized protein n=1 Tax=Malassezia japonica TaxID=223818 RepID=A0AAF0JBE6_9BASI|nr:uncharacterized protein MJAP1_003409 [Malassezia japonica]WFD40423.1 hypothetical protein MJAP1_003409 [Malassezia japonica]